ncbi:MAG: hypothetical protein J6B39_06020 [Lachnospiraceae bacterium]|nr:hypothetical protein [Lachnospiraceae bacterium]
MKALSSALFCEYIDTDKYDEQTRKCMMEEALELALKVVDGCVDIDIKAEVLEVACYIYKTLGDKKSAINLAMTMPTINRGHLLWALYEGPELARFMSEDIQNEMTKQLIRMKSMPIQCVDENNRRLYTLEEQLKIYKKVIDIYKILYEDEDFLAEAQWVQIAYFCMAEIYAVQKNADMMFDCLTKGIKYGIEFDDYESGTVHTSLLFRGIASGAWMKDSPDDSNRRKMLEWLAEPQFDAYRETERFGEIIKLIRA